MKNIEDQDETSAETRPEYDFSKGVRGKHHRAYRQGHTVKITKNDGSTESHFFTEEEGAVMLDPDVKEHFPDAESVNSALRYLASSKLKSKSGAIDMSALPYWMNTFFANLNSALEWDAMGTMDVRYFDEDCQLRLAPSPVELVGGQHDGEEVFSFYHLDIADLLSIFNESPSVSWGTREDALHIEGKIDDIDAWITFQRYPFDDERPAWVFDRGHLRLKET